ncbi:MAG: transporter [Alcanivorax sediminis]|uniref:transporter n=1 Tax=Alcanivorax sediminis TaxID=2663008 RepID=UPI003C4C5081
MLLRHLPASFLAVSAFLPVASLAHYQGGRVDSHAPISVMGDHTHGKGEWMLSYRYMGMSMSGAKSGSESLSTEEAFAEIPGMGMMNMKVLPYEMTMEMHMLGGMYAPTDNLTLVAMLPYATREMTAKSRMTMMMTTTETEFDTQTSGIGDVAVGGLYKFYDQDGYRVHLNLVLGLPTGSIEEEDYLPMQQQDAQLPYGMQLGSGSYEARPGITVNKQFPGWSWGAQASAKIALDQNDQGYKLGSRRYLSAWAARPLAPWASVSVAAYKSWWSDIHGEAEDLTVSPMMNPAADPDARGGQRLDLGLGVNLMGKQGALNGHRLAMEYRAPVQESLHGIQMETDYSFTVGWQKAFN